MATLNALFFDLAVGQQQLISDLLFDSSTRKTTLPGDLDLDANDLISVGTIDPDVLLLPLATSPAQTAEGSLVWDSDSDLLTVGDGAARKTMVDLAGTQTLINKTIDGDDNTLQDIATGSLKSRTGSDANVVTGTAGVSGDLPVWDANGDIIDGPTPPSGTIVGTSDSQTLTTKTIALGSNTISGTISEFNTALTDEDFATLAGIETLTNKTLTSPVLTTPQINDTSLDHQYIFAASELSADRTVTMPLLAGNDTFVFAAHAETLTNKSIDGDDNTVTDLPYSAIKSDSRTGSDTKLVTGTVGTSQNFAMWDANGDIVDSTKSASDLITTLGSLTDVTLTSLVAQDLLYRNAGSTAWVNLAKGSEGEFLTIASGVLAWGVSGAGSMSSFSLAGDSGTPQTIGDSDTLSILTGDGLASVAAVTDKVTLDLVQDVTGGGNVATVISLGVNGIAVGVDDTTIEDDGSGLDAQLRVKNLGIGGAHLVTAMNKAFSGGLVSFAAEGELTIAGTDFSGTDVPNASWVLAVAEGLNVHTACRVGTTQDPLNEGTGFAFVITGGASGNGQMTWSSGPTAIDGITLANTDRIWVKDAGMGETAEVMQADARADSSGDLNNTFFVFYTTPNLAYYVWFNVNSGGSDPAPSPPANVTYLGIEVAIATDATAVAVATATKAAIDAALRKSGETELIDCTVVRGTNDLTITNDYTCAVPDIVDGSSPCTFTLGTDTPGVGTNPCANGLYARTSANVWDRATDMDEDSEIGAGDFAWIQEGTVNAATGWIIVSINPLAISPPGSEPVDVSQFSGSGTYTAGFGLDLTGTVFSVDKATEVAGSRAQVYVASDGVGIDLDDSTLSHASSVLQVKANGITATEIDETDDYAWSGADTHTGSLDLSGTTLTVPLTQSITGGNTLTFIEENTLVLAKYASCVAEMLNNAAAGGISAEESVYLTAAGTIAKAIASTPAHADSFMGIVDTNASAGNPVIVRKDCRALALFVASLSLTVGDPVFLGLTAGRLTNVAPSSAGQVVLPVGHITDDLSYDGSGDFTAEVELKQLSPMIIV